MCYNKLLSYAYGDIGRRWVANQHSKEVFSMFGKFMNNYYYGKSGKGDYNPEDLPRTRMQLFWEMLRTRLSALMRLNLIYVLPWIPR